MKYLAGKLTTLLTSRQLKKSKRVKFETSTFLFFSKDIYEKISVLKAVRVKIQNKM